MRDNPNLSDRSHYKGSDQEFAEREGIEGLTVAPKVRQLAERQKAYLHRFPIPAWGRDTGTSKAIGGRKK